jgi:hypothetical protein
MMTALTRIHGGNSSLTIFHDRSGSGTPFTAIIAITAGTRRPATITDTGFVQDTYTKATSKTNRSGISTNRRG